MTPQEYCKAKAAQSGSSFYYSFMSLPDNQRDAIIALYAYCREVDDIVDKDAAQEIKAAKLAWWRGEIEELFLEQPQHPISRALLPAIKAYQLPKEYFLEILNGMEMDLFRLRFANFSELGQYCYRVAGVVGLLSAHIFGFGDHRTLDYASELGTAFQLTNIIRDVYEDINRDRLYLPLDEMAHFGVTEDDLRKQQQTPAFRALMEQQGARAKQYYRQAFALLPDADRFNQRAGIIMAAIYQALLEEIIQDDYQVLIHRVSLPPIRKIWLTWKTRLSERKFIRQQTGTRHDAG